MPILLITLKHNSFNSSISDPPSGSFQRFDFKGKSVRFQQRMKGLFAKFAFFKVLLKVQCSKLFICILSSQAFELGWMGGGGGGMGGEWVKF